MGEIRFAKTFPTNLARQILRWLVKEHNAKIISRDISHGEHRIVIEGDEIPPGNISFSVSCEEVVPKVLTFKIWP